MRTRVAVTATLLNLLVCVLLLVSFTVSARNNQNDLIREELNVTCRLSQEILDSAAFKDTEDYLRALSESNDMSGLLVAYIDADRTVAFKSFDFDIGAEHLKMLDSTATTWVQSAVFRGHLGEKRICSYCLLGNGGIITYARSQAGFGSFVGKGLFAMLPVMLAVLALQFLIIHRSVGRADRLVRELMSVLEDFTEGRFSSRMTNVSGFAPELTAEFNRTLARVQDRVFKQVRRNMVVGQMINQMQIGIITVDTSMNLTFANANAGRLYGCDVKDVEGQPFIDIFGDEDVAQMVEKALTNNATNFLTTETEAKDADGVTHPLRIYTSALLSASKCTGALVVIEDISEMRRLEQIRTDFAANVSHEMRTPLTSIKGFLETLQDGAIDNPELARKFLNIIVQETDRLMRLINDILSISRLESGSDTVEISRINLIGIIRYVVDEVKPQAQAKNVSVSLNNSEEPAWVMGNRDRVQQLVLNLVENAVKYNKVGGSVTVTVTQDSENLHMSVADTGIGIDEKHIGRLFERFYRVDKGRSRDMGGTGLGLAICKHIVNTMGGYIEVNSKLGQGTEFLVTLKKASPEDEATFETTSEE